VRRPPLPQRSQGDTKQEENQADEGKRQPKEAGNK
jgi:hypothetical protein